jgi:hypothetical protein
VVEFARAARAGRGRRVCVFGHLQMPPLCCGRPRRTTEGTIAPGRQSSITLLG